MDEEEINLLSQRLGTWNREFWRTSVVLTLALFAALGFLAYNFRLLSREIVRTRDLELIQRENVRSSRALSARILDLQDAERRRIARELHDSVGQYLVGLKINLEQLLDTRAEFVSGARKAVVRNNRPDRAFHSGSKDHLASTSSPAPR